MGKRTLRTLHFEMVAAVLKRAAPTRGTVPGADSLSEATFIMRDLIIKSLAHDFADEFEIRVGVNFDRSKFLRACGLEVNNG